MHLSKHSDSVFQFGRNAIDEKIGTLIVLKSF